MKQDIWIFLSHSNADFGKVREIRNYLEERGFRPLMFYLKCLESEEETFSLIKREIDVRTRFILCESDNARKSVWVKREMDYISASPVKRSFLKINLSADKDEICTKLEGYIRKTKVFLSYPERLADMGSRIHDRLSKFDLDVWTAFTNTGEATSQKATDEILAGVALAGFVVILCDGELTRLQESEFATAKKTNGRTIILSTPSLTGRLARESTKNLDIVLPRTEMPRDEISDYFTDEILWRILPPGSVLTMANNFRQGRIVSVDAEEAARLDNLLVRKAKESRNPAALVFLARCYENGEHGMPVDLHKAELYYGIAIHEEGREDLIPHARELNKRIYGTHGSGRDGQTPHGFSWKRLFKTLFAGTRKP